MARIYLAATFSRAEEMRGYRKELEKFDHSVTSRWIDSHDEVGVMGPEEVLADRPLANGFAAEDIGDIMSSELVVVFTEVPSTTGGRHTEFGIALILGKHIAIVGQRENVFQAFTGVDQFNNWPEFMEYIRSAHAVKAARDAKGTTSLN